MAQELYELPQGWEWRSVAQVSSKIQYGFTAKASEKGNARFLRITDIQNDHVNWDRVPFVQIETADLAKYQLRKNDIVFARSGATSGKSFLITEDPTSSIFASYLIRIVPSTESIYPEFLYKYFQAPEYWAQVLIGATGAAQPNINGKKLGGFILPVPPLAEQERIVAQLDALFSRIDQAIAQLQHTQAQTKALFASALDAVFSKASQSVKMLPFGEVVDNLDGKRIPIKASERKTTKGTYPYYGATGIIDYVDDFIFSDECLLISEDGANLVARKYPIAFIATGKYWVNNHAHVVSAKKSVTTNHFLEQWFSWISLASYITGAAQPKLSQKKMNSIPFPLIPLAEQSKIVAQLDAISERTQALTAATSAQLEKLQALKASLLDAAFRGQLPSDQ